MTAAQTRAYLAKATTAERTAYLSEVGLAQRFQAFDPLDREAVRNGFPRAGMSAEALRFVWGDLYKRVDVYLIEGKVVVRVDFALTTETRGSEGRCSRSPQR